MNNELARKQLETQGFCVYPQVFPESDLAVLRQEIDNAVPEAQEFHYGGSEVRLWGFENESALADKFKDESVDLLKDLKGLDCVSKTVLAIRNNPCEGKYDDGRWHLDSFKTQYKTFLFINDVDINNGPFEIIPKSNRLITKILGVVGLKYFSFSFLGLKRKYRWLKDDEYERKSVSVLVPAGTIVVADTSCIHRARPCKVNDRYALTCYF